MRENRPYGLEGGESGSTGLPYPYPLRLCALAPLRCFLPQTALRGRWYDRLAAPLRLAKMPAVGVLD